MDDRRRAAASELFTIAALLAESRASTPGVNPDVYEAAVADVGVIILGRAEKIMEGKPAYFLSDSELANWRLVAQNIQARRLPRRSHQ